MPSVPTIAFNNGQSIPALGLGTWQGASGKEAEVGDAVRLAIDLGYRHFDCAHCYRNEAIIGAAIADKIREGVVTRDELFITSKLWNTFHRADLVEPALRTTLKNLQLDHLDLYLVHWPHAYKEGDELFPKVSPDSDLSIASNVDYLETWTAMEKIYEKKLAKSIGVSNFNSLQLTRLLAGAKVVPVTNQIECHPYLNQAKLREFCAKRGITVTAYSPLGSPARPWQKPGDPDVINDAKIKQIAEKYRKTSGQILLRYNIQLGNSVIPKSSNRARLLDNINIFDFALSEEDMKYIDTFDCNGRICPNADARENPNYPFQPDIEF